MTLTFGSLFTGIGAMDLGLLRAGLGPVVWQVEIDEFCNRILDRHFPDTQRFRDVRSVVAPPRVGLICGGFPCQPVSVAGKGLAQDDPRWLWPEFRRLIAEVRPRWVLIENVPGLRTRGLRIVLADLASLGFDAEWCDFGAVEVGAPHKRRRVWIVASNTDGASVPAPEGRLPGAQRTTEEALHRCAPEERDAPDPVGSGAPGWLARALGAQQVPVPRRDAERLAAANPDGVRRLESALELSRVRGWPEYCGWEFSPSARVHDGATRGVVGAQRKAAGNAVVVACVEAIGRAIKAQDVAQSESVRCAEFRGGPSSAGRKVVQHE